MMESWQFYCNYILTSSVEPKSASHCPQLSHATLSHVLVAGSRLHDRECTYALLNWNACMPCSKSLCWQTNEGKCVRVKNLWRQAKVYTSEPAPTNEEGEVCMPCSKSRADEQIGDCVCHSVKACAINIRALKVCMPLSKSWCHDEMHVDTYLCLK